MILLTSLALLLAAPSVAPVADLRTLVERTPADSLAVPLRRFEIEHGRGPEAGEAALLLGKLQFARGEYRAAADDFTRAAARLEPARKPEARYWEGLAWMGVPDLDQARAALEEVDRAGGPRQAAARLAVAQIWERSGRRERARTLLLALVEGDPGESGPAALERLAVLEAALGHPEAAMKVRERLLRQYPRSPEASRETALPSPPAPAPSRMVAVQIGAFLDRARAQRLADAAQRAGFAEVQVMRRGSGPAALFSVVIGRYADAEAARRDGERAASALGVTWQAIPRP
jgi:tetratricopeptide (TPR) repeat protein